MAQNVPEKTMTIQTVNMDIPFFIQALQWIVSNLQGTNPNGWDPRGMGIVFTLKDGNPSCNLQTIFTKQRMSMLGIEPSKSNAMEMS